MVVASAAPLTSRAPKAIAYLMVALGAAKPHESTPAGSTARTAAAPSTAGPPARSRPRSRWGRSAGLPGGRSPLVLLGLLCLAAVIGWWTWRALHDPFARDTGLAWDAGRLAWATGHPERLSTWNGMTFLAATMAILGRLVSRHQAGYAVTAVNLACAVGLATVVLRALRRRLPGAWWWVVALALVSFGPLMSTVWWKQFNLVALTLAAGGFELARRERRAAAAFAIALSVSIKPLIFLLPVFMLIRRETRRIGVSALVWVVVLDVAGQALMALRAGNLAALDPTIGPRNLIHKTSAAGNVFLCHPLNFSPTSIFCRLNGGFQHWTLQRVAVLMFVGLLAVWVIQALRNRSPLSWEVFAFAGPLSVMLSALAWPHYQIMLAPLFILLVVRLAEDGRPGEWIGLVVAFALASVIWAPFGNLLDGIRNLPEHQQTTTFLEQYAQLAQYVLILTALVWYGRHEAFPSPLGTKPGPRQPH